MPPARPLAAACRQGGEHVAATGATGKDSSGLAQEQAPAPDEARSGRHETPARGELAVVSFGLALGIISALFVFAIGVASWLFG